MAITLNIELHLNDKPMLEYIKKTFGIGNIINLSKKNSINLRIGMKDLQSVLFPLRFYQGIFVLTDPWRKQYQKAIYVLEKNITKFS